MNKYILRVFFLLFFTVQVTAKNAKIGGVFYRNIDPGPDFIEEPLVDMPWKAPAASKAEVDSGFMVFRPSDPGDLLNYRLPRKSEKISILKFGVTPGETTSEWVGIRSLKKLDEVDVKAVSPKGIKIDVRRIHCWPQRSRRYNSRTYHIVPELLLKLRDGKTEYPYRGGVLKWRNYSLKKNETSGLWLTVKSSKDTPAGKYDAKILISAKGGKTYEVPLQVEVYPFTLPDKLDSTRWILYCWPNRYRAGANPILDIKDMVEHGMDGFLDNAYLMVNVSLKSDGSLDLQDRDNSKKWVEKIISVAKSEGMRGPFGLWTTPVNRQLAKAYGFDHNDPWPPEMYRAVKTVKQYFDKEYAKLGIKDWMSFASDEPKPGNTYAVEAIKAWKAAGAKTYCTAYFGTYITMAQWLTDPCIGYGDKKSRACINKYNARKWLIGDGCYIGKHEMGRHRRRAGVNFYLSKAYGCAIWRWGGSHGDPFNDFDGKSYRAAEPSDQLLAYPQMTIPNNWKSYVGPIPTIAWESIREGVNDYKYLYVLNQTIDKALRSDSPNIRALAAKDQKKLQELHKVVFDSSEVESRNSDVAKFDTSDIINIRRWAACQIVKLDDAMKKGNPLNSALAAKEVRIKVIPGINAAQKKNMFLPPAILSIPEVAKAPVIDGVISAGEWDNASEAVIPGSAATDVKIMSDTDNLYVSWICDEPGLARVLPVDRKSDFGPIWPQDSVEFFIVPSRSSSTFAHLMINHLGRWISECNAKKDWNAQAEVAAKHGNKKYVVEMALPWKQLAQIAPLPWKDVKLNFCRVRNPESNYFNTNKFNWAYGTGSFHKPDIFGVGFNSGTGIQIIKTSYTINENGTLGVNVYVRNRNKIPFLVRLKKIPGRKLLLWAKAFPGGKHSGVINPGKTGVASQNIRLERRAAKWALSWSDIFDPHELEKNGARRMSFKVPGKEDINPLVIDQKHFVTSPGKEIEVRPLFSPGGKGYIELKPDNGKSKLFPFNSEDIHLSWNDAQTLSFPASGVVQSFMLTHLNKDKKIISKTKITIVNLND